MGEDSLTKGTAESNRPQEAPKAAPARSVRPVIPGYDLVRIIGRGGMGVVWEAIEHRLDRRVALKVHADEWEPEHVARMWCEARLAAKVTDPGVVAVHDYGASLDGAPYYTMDLVEGTDLRALLREGPLPQARALTLGLEIARAVAAAHERGIVHRDLKPANVLVDLQGRARILDFGLAYSSTTGTDLYADSICGTPGYMSPEQVAGLTVGAASDIHAIGLLLYEMLTGTRPFEAKSREESEALVTSSAAPPPTQRNPAINSDVEQVCLRCLEKQPADRYTRARDLCTALEALVEGRPLEGPRSQRVISTSPRRSGGVSLTPQELAKQLAAAVVEPASARDEAKLHFRWSWELRSSPVQLWPHVSNTERLNCAIGLPAVEFKDAIDGDGAALRTGTFRKAGMEIAWREHPFEWIRHREHSVFRRYSKGPFDALWNRVQLLPKAGGGTTLVHEVWVDTKGLLGKIVAYLEVRRKTAHELDRIYRQIDERVQGARVSDPFEEPHVPSESQRAHVEAGVRRLIDERDFDPTVAERLSTLLLHGPSRVLERLRPYALSDAWKMERNEVLDIFLHAANVGLVDLVWDLICPRCLTPHESCDSLGGIARSGTCKPCAASYDRDLSESVELIFRPHPEVRKVTPATYCVGAPALRPHVFAQQRLAAGEVRTFTMELPPGDYRVARTQVPSTWDFTSSPVGFLSECAIQLDGTAIVARPGVVRAGEVEFTIANTTANEEIVRIEIPGLRGDGVSAATAMTLPNFRDFFAREMLADGEHMVVRRMAFLFLEIDSSAGLFQEAGDAGAWAAYHALDTIIDEQLRALRGVRAPASVGSYAIAFGTSAAAVTAALGILAAARTMAVAVRLRAAVHEGPCIALTRGKETEYFGKTVHRGIALLTEAPVGGLATSIAVTADRDVAKVILDAGATGHVTATSGGPYQGTRVTRFLPEETVLEERAVPA